MARRKVGFFGGTFDPFHFGHLNLALEIYESHQLDQVLFSPANFSPEKSHKPPQAGKHIRKEMVELGVSEIPAFTVIDDEIEREGPSYTIDTIRFLYEKYPDTDFYLILGGDMLKNLSDWKEALNLLKIAPPLIGGRPDCIFDHLSVEFQEKIIQGVTPISTMEISATAVRKRLQDKKFCGHLVPAKVLDYIQTHGLYLSAYAH